MSREGTSPDAQASSKTEAAKPKSGLAKPKGDASHQQGAAAAAPGATQSPKPSRELAAQTISISTSGADERTRGSPAGLAVGLQPTWRPRSSTLATRETPRARCPSPRATSQARARRSPQTPSPRKGLWTSPKRSPMISISSKASAHLATPSAGGEHQASEDSVHPRAYYPPDDSTGAYRTSWTDDGLLS
ncbi:unnamed protein product [Phytophthora lilii]|uniref:Unnamed protein product n=1 Tax=Phytophthora lilii TaxID=2077276 RepID=A0A9W7D8W5_9STRA|nr:unnamed protein product [Phytophthora lilii]